MTPGHPVDNAIELALLLFAALIFLFGLLGFFPRLLRRTWEIYLVLFGASLVSAYITFADHTPFLTRLVAGGFWTAVLWFLFGSGIAGRKKNQKDQQKADQGKNKTPQANHPQPPTQTSVNKASSPKKKKANRW